MAPEISEVVVPLVPTYHWYVTPAVFAAAISVADVPVGMVWLAGCVVNVGTQTLMVTVALLAMQTPLSTWFQ